MIFAAAKLSHWRSPASNQSAANVADGPVSASEYNRNGRLVNKKLCNAQKKCNL
jgi:hypothetical protein